MQSLSSVHKEIFWTAPPPSRVLEKIRVRGSRISAGYREHLADREGVPCFSAINELAWLIEKDRPNLYQ